jgi:glutathione-specific gamma-glutamylcyclotransferase
MVYRIAAADVPNVLGYLDHREKGGYSRAIVDVHFVDKKQNDDDDSDSPTSCEALIYMATPDNEDFAGEAPAEQIAAQIAVCKGPSGYNKDYLLNLAQALREMEADDPHVYELESLVIEILKKNQEESDTATAATAATAAVVASAAAASAAAAVTETVSESDP